MPQDEQISATTHQNLKVYTEALKGFFYLHHPNGLNNTLLFQGCVLGAASIVGKASRMYISRAGVRVRSPHIQLSGQGSIGGHILSVTSNKWAP